MSITLRQISHLPVTPPDFPTLPLCESFHSDTESGKQQVESKAMGLTRKLLKIKGRQEICLFYFIFFHEVLGRKKKPHPLEIYIWKPILIHLGRLHFAWVPWISGSLTLTLMFWVFTQEQRTSFQSRNVDFMQCLSLDQILFCEIHSTCYIKFTFNSK